MVIYKLVSNLPVIFRNLFYAIYWIWKYAYINLGEYIVFLATVMVSNLEKERIPNSSFNFFDSNRNAFKKIKSLSCVSFTLVYTNFTFAFASKGQLKLDRKCR